MKTLFRWFSIVTVTVYLSLSLAYLLVRGRVARPKLGRILRSRLRRPYRGEIAEIQHEDGHCFVARVPGHIASDEEAFSHLVLMEGDEPLPNAHSAHAEIRRLGNGRYSHWGDTLYFSTSDNTDPRNNSRKYAIVEDR